MLETIDLGSNHFRNRWDNCEDIEDVYREEPYMLEHLQKHFWSKSHKVFLNGTSVTFTDETYGKDQKKKKKRERKIKILKKMESYGLNIADSVYSAGSYFITLVC